MKDSRVGWKLYRDGWVECTNLSLPFQVFVRPKIVDRRAVIAELRLAHPDGITGGDLRLLRLDQIEASLQGRGGPLGAVFAHQDMVKALEPALSAHQKAVAIAERSLAPIAEATKSLNRLTEAARRIPVPKLTVKAKLKPPERPPYPDEFYLDVAESYLAAMQMGERPGPFLAGVWGVPTTTVHGWVKEARRRGILPPGRKGKAG